MHDPMDPGRGAYDPPPWPGQPPERPAPVVQPPRVPARGTGGAPDVLVDFDGADGLLHVVVTNIGNGPAYRVRVAFELAIPEIALFRRREELEPGREHRAFVDRLDAYFGREQPEVIAVTVTFHDETGRGFRRRIRHDLGIYRDLPGGHRRGG